MSAMWPGGPDPGVFDIVTLADKTGTSELDADQAKICHHNVLMAPWRDYEAAVAAWQEVIAEFIESVTTRRLTRDPWKANLDVDRL